MCRKCLGFGEVVQVEIPEEVIAEVIKVAAGRSERMARHQKEARSADFHLYEQILKNAVETHQKRQTRSEYNRGYYMALRDALSLLISLETEE